MVDGVELQEAPYMALQSGRAWVTGAPAGSAQFNPIDVIIGSNADDGTDFASLDLGMVRMPRPAVSKRERERERERDAAFIRAVLVRCTRWP